MKWGTVSDSQIQKSLSLFNATGRCQSGFCQFKVMKILARELGIPEEEVKFEEDHSPVLFGPVKK